MPKRKERDDDDSTALLRNLLSEAVHQGSLQRVRDLVEGAGVSVNCVLSEGGYYLLYSVVI